MAAFPPRYVAEVVGGTGLGVMSRRWLRRGRKGRRRDEVAKDGVSDVC